MAQTTLFLIFLLCTGLSAGDEASSTHNDEENRIFLQGLTEPVSVKTTANSERSSRITDKISQSDLEKVFKECQTTISQREDLERKLARNGRVVKTSNRKADPSLIRNRQSDPLMHQREKLNLPFDEATKKLVEKFNLTPTEVANDLPSYPVQGGMYKANRDACTENQPQGGCNSNSRFRTANGQCNNLNNPTWGMASACQQRLMQPSYVGSSGYRQSVSGSPLPAPRTLSLNLHYHLNRPTNYVTHMYMFFGQLLDHDITLTPLSTTIDNEAIECCPPETETHPQCEPIIVSRNDPFYSQFRITCLNFVRSAICSSCEMGYRKQPDIVTSYIDASFVYGNSDNETATLRRNDGTGRLRVSNSNYGDLLPRSPNPGEDQCSFPETNDICFQAGDVRANQHNVLTSLHTIFMREHNRICNELRRINSRWNDERLFQEARRILGAQMQVITYKEYLPITLESNRMKYFNLWLSDTGTTNYDPSIDATISDEFSTAAFRFGHSLINSVVAQSPRNATNNLRLLRNEFFQPFDLYNGVIGPLVRGASNSAAQWFDRHLVEDVTNFLYRIRGNDTGLDLAATNINRGRDHGLPPYVEMVRYCSEGDIRVRNFNDLVSYRLMTSQNADALSRNYRNVFDVDLWPGILMETPNEGSVVGPTAACIIGVQFNKLKFGDRFYFEHRGQAGSFTYQQRQELKRTSLSTIMCLNSDANQLPRNAMIFSSSNNPVINCQNVRGIDLSYWRE